MIKLTKDTDGPIIIDNGIIDKKIKKSFSDKLVISI